MRGERSDERLAIRDERLERTGEDIRGYKYKRI
jgi:hypothetical protein